MTAFDILLAVKLQTTHPHKPTELLQLLDAPAYAWQVAITDYITGLPLTADRHKAIAMSVDTLTKYVYAV